MYQCLCECPVLHEEKYTVMFLALKLAIAFSAADSVTFNAADLGKWDHTCTLNDCVQALQQPGKNCSAQERGYV